MHCDRDVVTLIMCSLGIAGAGKVFGSAHREKSGKCKVRKKRTFNLIAGQLALSPSTCNAQRWQELKMGSYLFTISQTSLTVSPSLTRLLSRISASSSSSVSLLSLDLYSPPPTIPSSLRSSRMVPFPLVLLPSCCGKHARTLTFSSFLSASLTLSLLLSFSHSPSFSPLPSFLLFSLFLFPSPSSLPLCMLENGMWVPSV